MFNLLLTLMFGIFIGWNFNAFYSALNAPQIIQNEINISQNKPIEEKIKELSQEKEHKKETIEPQAFLSTVQAEVQTSPVPTETISFDTLLQEHLFSDAMALYLDANESTLLLYRATLEEYFEQKRQSSPKDALREMLEYIDLEPEHKITSLQLVEVYKKLEQYNKAIEVLSELLENSNSSEHEKLHTNLLNSSQTYIELLQNAQNFEELQVFLEERIEYGLDVPFYTYALAQYYINLEKYDSATKLLKELEFDEAYGEKANNLLRQIEKGQIETEEYIYKIPLIKNGEHFSLEVMIDNTPLILLLDTGATLTMVNEDKLSSLTMINDHIILKTAGGEIPAQLQEADTFSVGEIELHHFQITTSAFKQEKADGLLGMNFFKAFQFKIDQENAMLYLSKKKLP